VDPSRTSPREIVSFFIGVDNGKYYWKCLYVFVYLVYWGFDTDDDDEVDER